MAIELRSVGPDDWELFRDVRLRSLHDAPAAFGSRYDDWVEATEEQWRGRLTDVPLTLLAVLDDQVVGVASGSRSDETWDELISMWVDPAARGAGVAAALIDAVVAWSAGHGRRTFLMVRAGNDRAIAAYEKAGFTDRGVPPDWPPDTPAEHRMERA